MWWLVGNALSVTVHEPTHYELRIISYLTEVYPNR
jgi:hypothetical protein